MSKDSWRRLPVIRCLISCYGRWTLLLAKTNPSTCVLVSICSCVLLDVTLALIPFFCIIKCSLSARSCLSTYCVIPCCYLSHHKRTPLSASSATGLFYLLDSRTSESCLIVIVSSFSPPFYSWILSIRFLLLLLWGLLLSRSSMTSILLNPVLICHLTWSLSNTGHDWPFVPLNSLLDI